MNTTFTINDSMTSTAIKVLDEPMEINNNHPKRVKKIARVKKGNGDGTPVTTKSGVMKGQPLTNHGGSKPKKLMDVTNIDSHEETFKIPINGFSAPKPLKSLNNSHLSFDDINISYDADPDYCNVSNFPRWCQHLVMLKKTQYYIDKEGDKS